MNYPCVFEWRKYHKIAQIKNGCYTSQKVTRSLADIAVHISKIKRRSARKRILKRANDYFFVRGPSILRVDYMGIKMSPKIPRWYMMAMWSMRKQKFIDQLSCKISQIMRKKLKWQLFISGHIVTIYGSHLDFISAKSVMGYPCLRSNILFYIFGSAILHFFVELREYHQIT